MGLFDKPQGTFPVVPLMGFPGARFTKTTIKQNLENSEVHFQSLNSLYKRLHPDAMITMMDLSLEAEAIGLNILKPDDASYTVKEHPVQTFEDIQKLKIPDPLQDGRMPIWIDVIKKMKESFDCPVMAYIVGPYTLAGLLTGATNVVKGVMKNPEFIHELLKYCSRVITVFGNAMANAGADALIMLEPTATVLSPTQFNAFSGQYVAEVFKEWDIPAVLHICGDTAVLIPEMIKTGCIGISVDYMVNMADIIEVLPANKYLIGNIDPVNIIAFASKEELAVEVNKLLKDMEGKKNFILSSGCDLPPETKIENLDLFVSLAKDY